MYISILIHSAYFLSLFQLEKLLCKEFNAFKAYILLLHVFFLTSYSNADAGAGYTFYLVVFVLTHRLGSGTGSGCKYRELVSEVRQGAVLNLFLPCMRRTVDFLWREG